MRCVSCYSGSICKGPVVLVLKHICMELPGTLDEEERCDVVESHIGKDECGIREDDSLSRLEFPTYASKLKSFKK